MGRGAFFAEGIRKVCVVVGVEPPKGTLAHGRLQRCETEHEGRVLVQRQQQRVWDGRRGRSEYRVKKVGQAWEVGMVVRNRLLSRGGRRRCLGRVSWRKRLWSASC